MLIKSCRILFVREAQISFVPREGGVPQNRLLPDPGFYRILPVKAAEFGDPPLVRNKLFFCVPVFIEQFFHCESGLLRRQVVMEQPAAAPVLDPAVGKLFSPPPPIATSLQMAEEKRFFVLAEL